MTPVTIVVVALTIALVVFFYLVLRPSRPKQSDIRPVSLSQTGRAGVAPSTPSDLSFLPQRFIVFDLETTGLNPKRHEIIEIGAIKVELGSDVHDTFQALLKPSRPISKTITRITGISQDTIDQDGEPLPIVLNDFIEFIGDLPLVAFNAEFDMAFLEKAGLQHNIVITNQVSCALKMARRAWPGRQSYRLEDIARDGKLSAEDTHRALGDCKRTLLVYTASASILNSR